ncbi:SMI1/KNR4 family protein [Paenibacillus sanfengchensis]|uniref:SMI1/KNR4 family protein n=1 Tax=Paenibacillus sanfengchensis TaxID=3119819 RepID=UPI002FE241D0
MKNQLNRIRRKLVLAAQADPDCRVFGARSHRYRLNERLSPVELRRFEQTHGIVLPAEYAAFLTEIGNGGAGPYYGIHPLGTKQSIEMDRMGEPAALRPQMSQAAMDGEPNDPDPNTMSDEEYDDWVAKWVQGLLNIGEQGCSYETMLVITGEYRGKVVYLDLDSHRSFFTYEEHFLDWYERWLDETIAGYDDSWFGMGRGGDDRALLDLYAAATEEAVKLEALEGMLKLPEIADETVLFLEELCRESSGEAVRRALQVLAKTRFDRAEPLIRHKLNGTEAEGRLLALQYIKWYMPPGEQRFTEEIVRLLPRETNAEAFRFMTYILNDAGVDMVAWMLPFFRHPDKEFRIQAVYQAGKSARKAEYLSDFMTALEDPEVRVQHIAVQALSDVPDPVLLESYERLLWQHKTDQDYIRSNVRRRLEEFGFAAREEMERKVPAALTQVRGILRTILDPDRRGRER